jgi:hypothetical protein
VGRKPALRPKDVEEEKPAIVYHDEWEEQYQSWHGLFADALPNWRWRWISIRHKGGRPVELRLEARKGDYGDIIRTQWGTVFAEAILEIRRLALTKEAGGCAEA